MPQSTVVYLHGMNSSASALKAQQTAQWLQKHHPQIQFFSPQIPVLPEQATAFLKEYLQPLAKQNLLLIGSSLGGLYARHFAQQLSCKAVLINPVVYSDILFQRYRDVQYNPYTHESYQLREQDYTLLKSMSDEALIQAQRLLVLLQMGDEVLEAELASRLFSACRCIIQPQGNHRFEHFEHCLPAIFAWFFMG